MHTRKLPALLASRVCPPAAGCGGGDYARAGTPGFPWLLPLRDSRTAWRSGALSLPDCLGSSPSYPTLTTCVTEGLSLAPSLLPPRVPPRVTGSHMADMGSPHPRGYYYCHGHLLSSDADALGPLQGPTLALCLPQRPLLWTMSPQAHKLCLGPCVPRLLCVPVAIPPSLIPGVLMSVHASHV